MNIVPCHRTSPSPRPALDPSIPDAHASFLLGSGSSEPRHHHSPAAFLPASCTTVHGLVFSEWCTASSQPWMPEPPCFLPELQVPAPLTLPLCCQNMRRLLQLRPHATLPENAVTRLDPLVSAASPKFRRCCAFAVPLHALLSPAVHLQGARVVASPCLQEREADGVDRDHLHVPGPSPLRPLTVAQLPSPPTWAWAHVLVTLRL
ncbi:uncharacterized protein LOC125553736 isoform X3 [Triticum urartu]|uniref:uncharacterized protein LOC125553736 isoform X3 n=1 Tax=Triticum urartu TaxID=4572 RepID=UPI002043BEE6|nr:uncharacterized protein LOC125553736 isoform X3 [Triticum urartu]